MNYENCLFVFEFEGRVAEDRYQQDSLFRGGRELYEHRVGEPVERGCLHESCSDAGNVERAVERAGEHFCPSREEAYYQSYVCVSD